MLKPQKQISRKAILKSLEDQGFEVADLAAKLFTKKGLSRSCVYDFLSHNKSCRVETVDAMLEELNLMIVERKK